MVVGGLAQPRSSRFTTCMLVVWQLARWHQSTGGCCQLVGVFSGFEKWCTVMYSVWLQVHKDVYVFAAAYS
jgi:hypothetical protein